MTATLISLISIFLGILGANFFGWIKTKYSFGIIGNTIAGVFGSIFFVKLFGRLGIHPKYILEGNTIHTYLLTANFLVSITAGIFAIYLAFKLQFYLKSKGKS